MRLDVYLSRVCLLKSRSLAKEACRRGKIGVNGHPAKGSRLLSAGDTLRVDLGTRVLEVEVTEIPPGQVAKKDAPRFYRVLRDERFQL